MDGIQPSYSTQCFLSVTLNKVGHVESGQRNCAHCAEENSQTGSMWSTPLTVCHTRWFSQLYEHNALKTQFQAKGNPQDDSYL